MLALASLASLMAALDTLVVTTALSTIRVDLGASLEQLEWTVNAYNLSFAVLLITGRRRSATGSAARRSSPRGVALFSPARPPARSRPTVGG